MQVLKAVVILFVAGILAHGQKLKDCQLATAASVLPPGLRDGGKGGFGAGDGAVSGVSLAACGSGWL